MTTRAGVSVKEDFVLKCTFGGGRPDGVATQRCVVVVVMLVFAAVARFIVVAANAVVVVVA